MWPSDPGCGVVTAVVQVQSLAWELMHVTDTAKKRKKSTPPKKRSIFTDIKNKLTHGCQWGEKGERRSIGAGD